MTARWNDPTAEQRAEWSAWVATRPPVIQAMCERFDPWTVYRLTTTGQACRVIGMSEGGTVRVHAQHPELGEISRCEVFGIDAATLEPWPEGVPFEPGAPPLPAPGDLVEVESFNSEDGTITFRRYVPCRATMPGHNGKARLPS